MSDFQTTQGFYVGKELAKGKSSGTTKDGKAYTRYKVKFRPQMDSDKEFSFTAFSPLTAKNTKQSEELKEGEQYKICYTEKEATNAQGQTFQSKTVVGFYSPNTAPMNAATTTTPKAQEATSKLDLSPFEEFKVSYLAKMKEVGKKADVLHMIGCFIAKYEKDRIAALRKKCEEALK